MDEPTTAKKKIMTEELYRFPPCIFSCDPVDSVDLMFVNHSSVPIAHSFKNSLNIEMYNKRWFHTKPASHSQKLDCIKILSFSVISEPIDSHPISDLYNDNILRTAPEIEKFISFRYYFIFILFRSIYVNNNKLCFNKYTLEDMLRARLYLIVVALDITYHLKLEPKQTDM